jgi:imidazolonepropionase-like amidohydrolase
MVTPTDITISANKIPRLSRSGTIDAHHNNDHAVSNSLWLAVANHCLDVHREEVFVALRKADIPIIYGPKDAFPYKVELKHESWKNAEKLLRSGAKFSIMSDHPVTFKEISFTA